MKSLAQIGLHADLKQESRFLYNKVNGSVNREVVQKLLGRSLDRCVAYREYYRYGNQSRLPKHVQEINYNSQLFISHPHYLKLWKGSVCLILAQAFLCSLSQEHF